jgi:hypothetical protein
LITTSDYVCGHEPLVFFAQETSRGVVVDFRGGASWLPKRRFVVAVVDIDHLEEEIRHITWLVSPDKWPKGNSLLRCIDLAEKRFLPEPNLRTAVKAMVDNYFTSASNAEETAWCASCGRSLNLCSDPESCYPDEELDGMDEEDPDAQVDEDPEWPVRPGDPFARQ